MTGALGIVGGGRFGRALAIAIAQAGRDVVLSTRDPHRLEGASLASSLETSAPQEVPKSLHVTTSLRELAAATRCIVIAVRAEEIGARSLELGADLDGGHLVLHALGAVVPQDGRRVTDVLLENLPTLRVGVLAGPAPASDLLAGRAVSMVISSRFADVTTAMRHWLSVPGRIRIYDSTDLVGVELSSAMATAYASGLSLIRGSDSSVATQALLVSRSVGEMHRLLLAVGSDGRAAFGLAGLGTMLATANADVAPVVSSASLLRLRALASQARVAMPLLETVALVANGELSIENAYQRLMQLPSGAE